MKNLLKVLVVVCLLVAFVSCNIPEHIKEKYGIENTKTGHEGEGDDDDEDEQETGGK